MLLHFLRPVVEARRTCLIHSDNVSDRKAMRRCLAVLIFVIPVFAQQHDLLLKGGRLIDPKNNIDAPMDVAVRAGKVSAVAPNIDASTARRTLDVSGMVVTPG